MMSETMVNKKSLQGNDSMTPNLLWIGVLLLFIAAICFHGSVMTNDEYTHWLGGVFLGVCQPTGMDILEFPGIASGKVPHLIWGNIGRIFGYHPMVFRTISLIISLTFAFIYWTLIRKKVEHSYVVMAFLLTYIYFFAPAHSILTDNFGLFFLAVFFALTLNEISVTALKGILGLIFLCLAMYTRIFYIVFPFAFLFVAISSYAFKQRPSLAKITICFLGMLSILALAAYWGGFVQPLYQGGTGHRVAITIWLPVLVMSTVGIFLCPLIIFMPIKRSAWIAAGLLSPFFIGFISSEIRVTRDIIGGLSTTTLYMIGKSLLGSQTANWIFFPFWIIGLVLLVHLIILAYEEIRKTPVWSESPAVILIIASLGFLCINFLTPMWSERYLAPFFICFFPFMPYLIKRWKKAIWAWVCVLLIVALGHMVIQGLGYKRGKVLRFEGLETTLQTIEGGIEGSRYGYGSRYVYLVEQIRLCLKNE
jgi:hypothetical protein